MRLVSRQAATGGSSSHGKWRQSGLARSLFNTPTTQLWYATGTNTLSRLDTSLKSGNGIGEPVTTLFGSTFGHCLCQMPADRLSPTAKGPVPQPRQEHPSEGQLWVRDGTGLHTEPLGSFRLLGYLVLFFTEGTLQQHARPPAGHTGPALPLGPREQSARAQVRHCSQTLKVSGYSSKRCPGGKPVLLLTALWLYLVILASSASWYSQAASLCLPAPPLQRPGCSSKLLEAKKNGTMSSNKLCSASVSRPARGALVQTSKTRPAGTILHT